MMPGEHYPMPRWCQATHCGRRVAAGWYETRELAQAAIDTGAAPDRGPGGHPIEGRVQRRVIFSACTVLRVDY
jgi:hypothetical protein